MAKINLFDTDPVSEILASTPVGQDSRDADIPNTSAPLQGAYDNIRNAGDITRRIETGELTVAQAKELAENTGIFVPGLVDNPNLSDPAVDIAARTPASRSDFGQPDVSSFAPTSVAPDLYNGVSTAEDIDRLLASGDITNAQAVEIANAKRIFVPGLEEYLKFDDPQQGVQDRGYEALAELDEYKADMGERIRLEEEQAQILQAEEQEQAKEEAEEEALAAEDDAEEAEQLQEDFVSMFNMDDDYSPAGYDYGYEFAGFDDFDAYLEDELEDYDHFDEEWAEAEMQYGMDIDGDGVIGSIDGVDFTTEDMSVEGAEVEGAAVEGDEIGDPELEKSALTGPELDGPTMGDEIEGEGKEEGLDADGKAKGVDGEDAGEMQVGELQAEGSERDGAGLDAGEMEVAPLGDITEEIDGHSTDDDKAQTAAITPAAAPVSDMELNSATALASMSGDANAADIFFKSRDEIQSSQNKDAAQTGLTAGVNDVVETTKVAVQDQPPAAEAAATAPTPEPDAPAKTETAAAKTLGLPVKFGEMEPWVKDLSSKFQGMVDPSQFVNLAATNISPTGKVPQEHGTGMAYNPSLPNLGGAQQLAV